MTKVLQKSKPALSTEIFFLRSWMQHKVHTCINGLFSHARRTQHNVSKERQRHLEAAQVNASTAAHSYVSPATSDPASRPALWLYADAPGTGSRSREGSGCPSGADMGEIILPRRMFLWSMAVIYVIAFVSLYVQIPGETTSCNVVLGAC